MNEMKWIPIREKLPKSFATVIVTTSTNVVTTAFMTIDRRWVKIVGEERYFKTAIIAWMPFPEPYKEGREDDHTD